jgi:predicted DNA-binding transcriptional regulator YafY
MVASSPTARSLLALEMIQNSPGITAERLGERLGVTERAARRYVAILREADLPIESVTGPYGGYRVGRGLRLPPLMFTAAEALGLAMAVIEGDRNAADPTDLVGSALAKIVRALPAGVAGPVRSIRETTPRARDEAWANPELTNQLVHACVAAHRLRLGYYLGNGVHRVMEVDPWAVVLRHSRWYLLCWSHTRQAQRVLRVDRVDTIEALPETFSPPQDLDALGTLEEQLSRGWTHPVDVLIEATVEETAHWIPKSLGTLAPDDEDRTRLTATTEDPDWYARKLAAIPAPFHVIGSAELQRATTALGERMIKAGRC